MTITSLTYEAPIRRTVRQTSLDYDKLEEAANLADEGRPIESLVKVFEHFFPNEPAPDFAKAAFSFNQGSSRVTTKVENDHVVITVPLIKLPAGGSAIAAMRHILSTISATGQLYQPRLHGDDVYLEFSDRLSRFHPAKVVEVLRRMPEEADNSDDFLIGQFSAQPLDRVPFTPLDATELARAQKIWKQHWSDMDDILKESQRKRSVWFLNEVTGYAVHRIGFALPLNGFVASRLDEAAQTFNDSDEDPQKRETTLAKCIKDMKAVSPEELAKSMGHASYAISPTALGTPARLGMLGPGNYMETIESYRTTGKSIDAALALIGTYNFLLARFAWDEEIEVPMKAGLAKVSGKSWKEAATILMEDAKELVEKYGALDDEDEEESDDEKSDDEEEGDGDDSNESDDEDGDEESDEDGK